MRVNEGCVMKAVSEVGYIPPRMSIFAPLSSPNLLVPVIIAIAP